MTFQREDIDVYLSATNRVNHAVLVSNTTTPFSLEIAFQWLWFTQACKWMLSMSLSRAVMRFIIFSLPVCFQ